jgi:thiol:disulfide interchange protein
VKAFSRKMKRGSCGSSAGLGIPGLLIALLGFSAAESRGVESGRVVQGPVALEWGVTTLPAAESSRVSVRLTPAPGWHLYWKNPGESGLPVRVEWTLPSGIQAEGELRFPRPTVQAQGRLVNYGYAEPFEIVQDLKISRAFLNRESGKGPRSVLLRAKLRWLVCQESCIPGKAELSGSFPLSGSVASLPESFPGTLPAGVTFRIEQSPQAWFGTLEPFSALGWKAKDISKFFFFPGEQGWVEPAGRQEFSLQGDSLKFRLPRLPSETSPEVFSGVLASGPGFRNPSLELSLRLKAVPLDATRSAPSVKAETFWSAVLGAFLGGLLLNLMPCVFPVLWLKILQLMGAHQRRREALVGAVSYSIGVLVSFWALGLLLLVLRAGGEKLGWGFQLQSPVVVSLLGLLFFGLGLNLLGLFEIGGGRLAGLGDGLTRRSGWAGSFFTGVLATIVATPCTAPFMGASLGYAVTQPGFIGLGVFTALGFGMALPFVVFAAVPALGRLLPKPGPWMTVVKKGMAFPLFATTLWLLWVLWLQVGAPGVGVALLGLTGVLASVWIWLRAGQSGRGVAALLAFSLMIGGVESRLQNLRASGAGVEPSKGGLVWEAWSPERVRELRAQRRAFLIDFTAAWCVTCQVNEQVAFGDPSVQAALLQRGFVLLKADWTQADPRITDALGSYGRNGVPLYVHDPGAGRETRLWPQILTPSIVLQELEAGERSAQSESKSSNP